MSEVRYRLGLSADSFFATAAKAKQTAKSLFESIEKDASRLVKWTRLAASLKDIGQQATQSLTLPIAAGLGAAVKLAADFDAAMSKSVAIMSDLSDKQRARMEANAKGVAESLNMSASSAAESYYFLASAGLDAEQLHLGPVAVGDGGLEEIGRAAGHLGQPVAEEPAGAGLGASEGQPALAEQGADDLLEGLAAAGVDPGPDGADEGPLERLQPAVGELPRARAGVGQPDGQVAEGG